MRNMKAIHRATSDEVHTPTATVDSGMSVARWDNGKVIEAFKPIWAKDGNVWKSEWFEDFEDRAGNKASLRMVAYTDKKGKPQEIVAQVIWRN